MIKKITIILVLILGMGLISCSEDTTTIEKKVIVVDGGGDIGNFNTTPIMTQSEANPFPYNTLEVLAEEWEGLNPDYDIVINATSSNGDRNILIPQLNNKTAPDITYQNGTVASMDIGKDYYVELDDYLDMANPYVEGNERWSDLYVYEEIMSTTASNGHSYYICLEKIPVGILYNKDILTGAGVTKLPTTYSELLEAMESVVDNTDKQAYSTTYTWYDILLESTLFSDLLDSADTLRSNGVIDTEEFVRAYTLGLWNPDYNGLGADATLENNRYQEYIEITKMKTEFYPENWQSYDSHSNFVNGNLAMLEVTGKEIRKLSINSNIDFEWGVMPYPELTTETSENAGLPAVRGVAGLATPWFITNSAIENETVEGCVDFLMFLTAPENNNRLIGDLKGGIPLNPSDDTEIASYLEELLDVYVQDLEEAKNGERIYWGAVNSWNNLGYAFNTTFIKNLQDIDNNVKTIDEATKSLIQTIDNTIKALRIEYEYDETEW